MTDRCMTCIKTKENAYYYPSLRASRCGSWLFLFEILVFLVVVISQVLQLFAGPSLILLAMGTVPCAFLWKRPLTAFILVCTSVTIYFVFGGSIFHILTRIASKCSLRGKKRKKARRSSRRLYVPHNTIVDPIDEELDDAYSAGCATKAIGSNDTSTEINPKCKRMYSSYNNSTPYGQNMDTCGFRKNGNVFSRRGKNNAQSWYRVSEDTPRNVDIEYEMEVAESMMDAMLSAFSDT